jgi:hypothetical protein
LLSTSALAGSALRGLVLASGALGVVLMALPADAFTCGNSSTGTGFPSAVRPERPTTAMD